MSKCDKCQQDKEITTDEMVAERSDIYRAAYGLMKNLAWADSEEPLVHPMGVLAVAEFLAGESG